MSEEEQTLSLEEENDQLKKAVNELRAQNQLLNEELKRNQQGRSGNWEMNLVDNSLTWSPGIYHMLEVSEDTQPDMLIFKEKLTPIALDRLNGAISKTFVSGQEYSFEHTLMMTDRVLSVRTDLKPVYNEQKMPVKLIGKLTDISATKSAQKELEKLSMIAAQTSNAVVMLSVKAKIDWVNNAFTIMTGYRPDEVKGELFDTLAREEHDVCCADLFEEAFRQSHSVIHETIIETKNGKMLWVIMNASAVLDYELNAESYIVIITDITDQKNAEAQLAEKNREITDSIRYAKRLQDAMLPSDEIIRYKFKDSFIYYRPKDIVSGDFYWMRSPEDIVFVAVADCTGHGVPGAFVSLIGNRAMDRAVLEFGLTDPAKILDKISEIVEGEFSNQSNVEVRDGMDICLLAFDFKKSQVTYSGANNPLYFIRNSEFNEIKGDKQPIGPHDHRSPFVSHTIDLEESDQFYLFSDGFPDQFGGPKGKKFKYRTFKELILANHQLPMEEQEEKLNSALVEWKGNLEQVDDICVMGIKV